MMQLIATQRVVPQCASAESIFDFWVAGFTRTKTMLNKTGVCRLRLQFITLILNLDEALVACSSQKVG